MKVIFSKHAREQIVERNISEKEIISSLLNPEKIIAQSSGKFQAVKALKRNGRKYLMVVIYRQINSSKKIITAFLTTKIKKYLQ